MRQFLQDIALGRVDATLNQVRAAVAAAQDTAKKTAGQPQPPPRLVVNNPK